MAVLTPAPSSFRDNSGFVFLSEGQPFRQVNEAYRNDFEELTSSGLCAELQDAGQLVGHELCSFDPAEFPGAIAVLHPERVPFISYPYEWSFGQLKDAALCTLQIQRRALGKGMSLKDGSSYNIQFLRGKPILIDTLSFERYEEGLPWRAYRQFCEHFLAPLALMAYSDVRSGRLMAQYIDGVPLDLAAHLLPFRTRFKFGLAIHLHAHAKAQLAMEAPESGGKTARVSRLGLLGLLDSLERTIRGLRWTPKDSVWADYYKRTNYSTNAMEAKHRLVREYLGEIDPKPHVAWDLGANTGEFSRMAADLGALTIAWDIDPVAVELHYRALKNTGEELILPLVQDLTNPSPGIGWVNQERDSFVGRANADVVMALALAHHLAIGNNVPLVRIADFMANLAPWLIIEFVPKSDSQVRRLLATRPDIYNDYNFEGFESAFESAYRIIRCKSVAGSDRSLYLMKRR